MALWIGGLALSGVAALMLLRARRRRDAGPTISTRPPSKRPSAGIPMGASTRSAADENGPPVKSCPVCLGEFPPQNRFCVRDGAPLNQGPSSGPFSHGMICPTCRRGYTADASFCPEDSDELVPYGLFGASSATRPPLRLDANKICPECGVRHAPTHLFCGHDGAELVVVN